MVPALLSATRHTSHRRRVPADRGASPQAPNVLPPTYRAADFQRYKQSW